MHEAILSVTVALPFSMTGAQLMEAVKAAVEDGCDQHHPVHFVAKPCDTDSDVFTIGQYSRYAYAMILVSPTRDVADINRKERYSSVEVASHDWPFGLRYANSYDDDYAAAHEVRKFASRLERHLAHAVDAPERTYSRTESAMQVFGRKMMRRFRMSR
jgi:hypothetical protein